MRIDVFCHQKNNKKADSLYMKLSSTKSAGVQSVCIPYFKINTLIYCCPRLFEEYLNPQVRINKMVNDHSVNYHPNLSGLISRIDPLKFLWIHYRFISPEYLLSFSQTCISHFCWGKFSNLWCSDHWKMHFWVKKLDPFIVTDAPLAKLSPRFLSSPQVFALPYFVITPPYVTLKSLSLYF